MLGLRSRSVERQVADLKAGDHVCSVYQDRSELAALVTEFMKAGLAKGFRCSHVVDDQTVDEVRQALAAAGVDVGREQGRGALRLLTKQDAYIRDGEFSPAAVLEFLRREEAQAVADGFAGLWYSGEMTWALGKEPGCDWLVEYEILLDQMAGLRRSVVLCQFDEALFGRHCVHDLQRLHSGGVLRPATEPGQPAGAAGDREELYRFLMENTHDVVSLHDVEGHRVYVSPSCGRLLGWVPARPFEGIHPEDLPAVRQIRPRALTGERTVVIYRHADADGSWRWLESSGSLVQFRGRPHVLAVTRDVTESKQAEAQLRLIIDTIPAMVFTALPDGFVDYINQRWQQFLGLPLETLQGWNWDETIHPEDRAQATGHWRSAIASGQPSENELRVRRADGVYRWILGRFVPLRDESGKIVRWYGVSTDIDDRKRAEQTVRESQELLQLVLATLPVGVTVTDLAGDVVLANAVSERIWGGMIVPGSERWAQSRGYWHDSGQRIEPENWASARALCKGQTSLNELIDIETFDGQKKTIQNSAAPVRDAEGSILGAVVVNEDVTERVRAERSLAESAERLQHLSRRLLAVQEEERRHIARELHDEFGQLLACATLHLHAARGAAGEAARPRLDECVSILRRAGEQVRGLALRLRPTMLETAGLDAALRWLAEQHQRQTGVVTQVAGHLNGVSGDLAIACFRVVQEALTNVVRHAQARHVWVELSRGEGLVRLVVRDDGVGFDVARTLEEAAAHGRLGLLGMRERVQILGGSLTVESEPGRGTRVRVSFPLAEPADS